MKLQGVAVVFALIVLPIIMILSLYLSYNIDTIALQTSYDTKLLDATYDAVSSIEINTANEDLSSVADSLRSIIDASANTFVTSISASLGLSSSSNYQIQPYIPALLYTVYDGFYIYTPTNVPKLDKDDNGIAKTYKVTKENQDNTSELEKQGKLIYKTNTGTSTTIDGDTIYTQDYLLKPFMQYAATYDAGAGNIITVNYTLDNYITINGEKTRDGKNVIFSKSGYLIDTTGVSFNGINGGSVAVLNHFNAASEEELERKIDEDREIITHTVTTDTGENVTYEYQGSKCRNFRCEITKNVEVTDGVYKTVSVVLDDAEAIKYYAKAYIFSNWVYINYGNITESNLIVDVFMDPTLPEEDKIKYTTVASGSDEEVEHRYFESISTSTTRKIFQKTTPVQDESGTPVQVSIEDDKSIFSEHKKAIMQEMITYNLNTAIATYNEKTPTQGSYRLPIMSGEEWDILLNNMTMIAYLQNLPCGMKTYSKYAVVPSTNNEMIVNEENLVFITSDNDTVKYTDNANFDGLDDSKSEYHLLNCDKLRFPESGEEYQGYREFDFIYDRMLDENGTGYKYDHKNLGCYYCMVSKNYTKYTIEQTEVERRYKAYWTALGRERQNVYKSIGMPENYGYYLEAKTLNDGNLNNLNIAVPDYNNIKDIHITISSTATGVSQMVIGTAELRAASGTRLDYLPAKENSISEGSVLALNLNSSTTQTLEFNDIKNCTQNINLVISVASGIHQGETPEIHRNSNDPTLLCTIKYIYW